MCWRGVVAAESVKSKSMKNDIMRMMKLLAMILLLPMAAFAGTAGLADRCRFSVALG